MDLAMRYKHLRITLTLEDERAAKLKELQSYTGLSAGDVLDLAIDRLHQQHSAHRGGNIRNSLSSEFIGCAEGPHDLAEKYKQYLAGSSARTLDAG